MTRADWAALLVSTYAAAHSLDEDLALERLEQAVRDDQLVDGLTEALELALLEARGKTPEGPLLDRFAKALQKRRHRVRAAPSTPEISAALVRIDLTLGLAPAGLRDTLESEKGAGLLAAGLRALGAHLVREILK
ncbi:MAG: hypothetical protein ACYDCL_06945 [Myxococcales bacterium]